MIEDFFQIIINLKKIHRKGWETKLGIDEPESVADHSFNVALMALVLGEMQGLNMNKVVKMALIHDASESITGDFTPDEINNEDKKRVENDTMIKILSTLPKNLFEDYSKVWQEFLYDKTPEANFVHDIDKLEMALQAKKYLEEGHSKDIINQFVESANKKVRNPQLRKILHNIVK